MEYYLNCEVTHLICWPQEGLWVGVENGSIYFANTIPGFLNCSQLGTLPGCLFKFDSPDDQCATGRNGTNFTCVVLVLYTQLEGGHNI